ATKLRQREVRASGDQCAEAGRVGEIAAVDRGAAEVDGVEHRALQVRAGEDRTDELRPLQIGAREPGDAVQRCSAEVRVGKRGIEGRPDEGRSDELSAGEHRPVQVGAPRAAVLDAAQAGLAEVRTGESCGWPVPVTLSPATPSRVAPWKLTVQLLVPQLRTNTVLMNWTPARSLPEKSTPEKAAFCKIGR